MITISRTQLVGVALAVMVAVTAVAWVLWPSTPPTFNLQGSLELADTASIGGIPGSLCVASNGYSDVVEGAPVTVYDATGKAIALGRLGKGNWVGTGVGKPGGSCVYPFTVQNVPASDVLSVEVSHRGKVNVTLNDAKAGKIALALGG